MKLFFLLATISMVVCGLSCQPVIYDEDQHYDIIPRERFKRQETKLQIKDPGIAKLSHTGTIIENDNHRLDGTGYVIKDLRHLDLKPDVLGGHLDYSHRPTNLGLGLGAEHVRGGGTGVEASGTWNFVDNKDAKIGLSGYYGREFGGPWGASRPDYGVKLNGRLNF